MFGKKKVPKFDKEASSALDGLIAYEEQIQEWLESEDNPEAYLAHSNALERTRRVRGMMECIIFGRPEGDKT